MSSKTKREIVTKWAEGLTEDQMRAVLIGLLLDFAIEAEYVRVGNNASYYEATGEPLVEGQEPWVEESDEPDSSGEQRRGAAHGAGR